MFSRDKETLLATPVARALIGTLVYFSIIAISLSFLNLS